MFSKNSLFFLSLSALLFGAFSGEAQNDQGTLCATTKSCSDPDNPCKCYCSKSCGPRDKQIDDNPIFVQDDPAENFCYCKQWDKDNYEDRCAYQTGEA
jgi:hypothetical protein